MKIQTFQELKALSSEFKSKSNANLFALIFVISYLLPILVLLYCLRGL